MNPVIADDSPIKTQNGSGWLTLGSMLERSERKINVSVLLEIKIKSKHNQTPLR